MKTETKEEFEKVWTHELVRQILCECHRSYHGQGFACQMSDTFKEIWSTHSECIRLLGNAFCPECATMAGKDYLFDTIEYRKTVKGISRRQLVIDFLKAELIRLNNAN